MNLAVNARDAMPDGRPAHHARPTNVDLDEAAARAPERGDGPGPTWCSRSATPGRAWTRRPARTSSSPSSPPRSQGKGTGLGLSHRVRHREARAAGTSGWSSEPGRGTTFTVCLPRVAAKSSRRSGRADAPPAERRRARGDRAPGRGETILLVEDAPRVREVVREILEMSGYARARGAARAGGPRDQPAPRGSHPPAGHRRGHAADERARAGAAPGRACART